MSTRVVRSMADFLRHGLDVEVECACGHRAALDADEVYRIFSKNRWYMGLNDGFSMGSPYSHFFCTRCWAAGKDKVRPKHIGPRYR